MKRILLIFMLFVITPPFLALASDYTRKDKAGDYGVEVIIDKNPPGRGSNNMTIYITDSARQPVTDVLVKVNYLMPSLPGRPPMMDYYTEATLSGNHYLAKLNLSMAGEWTIIISVTHEGITETMRFSFVVK